MKYVCIIGASSAIAHALARGFAERGCHLFLVARNPDKLKVIHEDVEARGTGTVKSFVADPAQSATHEEIFSNLAKDFSSCDTFCLCYGSLVSQEQVEKHPEDLQDVFQVNLVSAAQILTRASALLRDTDTSGERKSIIAISSVAGDRGRQSNYAYGAAKAGLSVFLQGLRNRLFADSIHVIDIKPGFVDTPMTAHMKKGPLFVRPEHIARDIIRALEKGKHEVYTPWFWRWIMLIICSIPEFIFKRLRL